MDVRVGITRALTCALLDIQDMDEGKVYRLGGETDSAIR